MSGVPEVAATADTPLGHLAAAPGWRSMLDRADKHWHRMFAVGTPLSKRPPHRSVRAEFPHTAPTSGV
jgi:hypothetical protein